MTKTKTTDTQTKRQSAGKAAKAAKLDAKKALEAAVAAALAEFGFPMRGGPGLCFTPEDDALFQAGFPEMRFLTDDQVAPEKALERAEMALDAIDPALRLAIPRDVARLFLLGYQVGPCLFVGPNHYPENAELRVERARAMRESQAIDVGLLESTLDRQGWDMGDTYGRWRWPKVLFLYEAFIGTEPVARAVVRHLLTAASDIGRWGFAGEDTYRTNATPHHIALALPWLLLRCPPAVAIELRELLGTVRHPDDVPSGQPRAYFALLHAVAHPEEPEHPSVKALALPLAIRRRDADAVRSLISGIPNGFFWDVALISWLLGTAPLAGDLPIAGHILHRLVDRIAPIRDPGIVRLIARIATQRAGKSAAAEWLRTHAAYAWPILKRLAKLDDEKEVKAAKVALDLVGAPAPPAPPELLDGAALEAEIKEIFGELGTLLRDTEDRDAQIAAIRDAHERYTEARAAAGDPVPEAYFTHRFGDFGLGQWAMLAVDAIE